MPRSFFPTEQASNFLPLCAMPLLSLSLSLPPHTHCGLVLRPLLRPTGAWSSCRAWRVNPRRAFFPGRLLLPQRRAGTRLHLLQPCRRCARLEGRCRARGVAMPSSDWSRPLGRSNPPAARDDCGLGRRGQRQPVVPGFGVVVAGSPLPQLDLGTTAPPPLPASPVSPAAMHLARKTSLCARDLGEGAGMQDLACCRLVKTTSTTRRHAFAPPRATGQLRRLARRHRGRQ
jgi:hypothetical protein